MPPDDAWTNAALDLAKAVRDFCENDAPDEWDGGSAGYALGGLWDMATELIEMPRDDAA